MPVDGDEMNLHMAQDVESEAELLNLAAVPYQIVSPANNATIVGIFQDALLGAFRFSRENIDFNKRDAMNMLMSCNDIDLTLFGKDRINSFEILTQITPPLSVHHTNGKFKESEDKETSNNVLEIINGVYKRGQLDKSLLGARSKGLLHRICNDFGNMQSSNYIDDLQNIVTDYMKVSSFSVGISDLISNKETKDKIIDIITKKKNDVKELIDKLQLGTFTNDTGKPTIDEFEQQVNNLLNEATGQSGKVGLANLDKGNRFVEMVNAGSKGSDLNISFMISCLGQQNINGKRIPYGFEDRTLPHFSKYDDSTSSRGFVESSYIEGLTPHELFFHAMGGRVGLIDTAVKTSQTGYIQRRLIKGMEDLKVEYDLTVRNNKGKIIQYKYGDNGMDTVKFEKQFLPLSDMGIDDIYEHYYVSSDNANKGIKPFTKNVQSKLNKQKAECDVFVKKYIEDTIKNRELLIKHVWKKEGESTIHSPVAFKYIIENVKNQCNLSGNSLVDITPLECCKMLENTMQILEGIRVCPPNELFKALYTYYLSPRVLLFVKRFNQTSLSLLLEIIVNTYKKAIIAPGEMVGMIAAQSIGEPTTQMSQSRCENIRIIIKNKHTNSVTSMRTEIGTLCDELIKQLPEYTFNTGHHDSVETLLDTLDDEYYIIGVDGEEKTHWNKISHVSRHPVNGEMMKVTTKSGRIVETTTSHSHLIRKDNTVAPITGSNMTVGMRIPVAKHIDHTFEQCSIEIGEKQYKLDYLFGWFVGAYLAEGHISKNRIGITSILEAFIKNTQTFAGLFGKTTYINNRPGEYGPGTTTSFSHKELAQLLLKTCNTGSFVKTVPEFAFTAPNEFKAGLIQAYFDGDGNIVNDANHHQIRVCSRSKQLIKDMALMINYFDIFGSIKENTVKGSPIYNLAISSKYAELYQKHIGSLKHGDILNELVKYNSRENIHSLSDDIDRINGLGDVIAKCGKVLKLPGQSRTYGRWVNKESIGRRTLDKYIDIFTSHSDYRLVSAELEILQQAANSGVIWDEVKSIEIYTPEQTEYVYDFTVPANQTFMTDYGIIVHNTLNTFHFAGVASKSNVTRGVPRIEEILSLTENIKNPSLTIALRDEDEYDRQKASQVMYTIEKTTLKDLTKSVQICFDPNEQDSIIGSDNEIINKYRMFEDIIDSCDGNENMSVNECNNSKWVIRIELKPEVMLEKNITMDDVYYAIQTVYSEEVSCIFSDYNHENLIFRIRINKPDKKKGVETLDQTDEIYVLKNFQDTLMNNIVLRGIKNIKKVILRKIPNPNKDDSWVLDTDGSNLMDILALDYINYKDTVTNNIVEMYNVLGIEAARQSIYNELADVIEFDGTYINAHHMNLLCDRMTCNTKLVSIFRHGINNDDIGPIAKASFEETPEMFLKAARHGELDIMTGISANVMCGQEANYGTNMFRVLVDTEKLSYEVNNIEDVEKLSYAEELYKAPDDDDDAMCSINKINIQNNSIHIKHTDMGKDDDDYHIDI